MQLSEFDIVEQKNNNKEIDNINKKYKIVTSLSDKKELEDHIINSKYIAFDTETNGLSPRSCKMIGFSVSGDVGEAFYYPLYKWNGNSLQPLNGNLEKVKYYINLLKSKKLIMWNGSYDIQVVQSNFNINLTDSLWIEGMLIKHTLNENGPFALKTTGIELQEFIGLNVEEAANKEQLELYKNIEKNGGSTTRTNLEMYKADLMILGKYACADADLTRRICKYYYDKLKEEGLKDFFFIEEVMPLYKNVTIKMESKGVKLDISLINKSKLEIEKDIILLENKVIEELKQKKEFQNWLKDTAIKKYPPKKGGLFGKEVIKRFNLESFLIKTSSGGFSLTKKSVDKLIDSEVKEFLLGRIENPSFGSDIAISIWESKNEGLINLSSKPQMSDLVFNYMKVAPISFTEKGTPRFNVDVLESLSNKGDIWARHLYNYNKLIKIRGTYIDRFLSNQEEGKYYFSYKQHGTISGRYGSDAQQLPRPLEKEQDDDIVLKYNNRIRKFFISDNDRLFVDCDYESLEPHVFAHVSNDIGLISIFNKGHDFYSTIAIATEGLYQYSPDKKADNYLGKLNKQKRQTAKAYALGVPYGMGAYALGKSLDIPIESADVLINNYLTSYPELKKWMDRSKRKAQLEGFVKAESGRVRHLPRVKHIYKVHGDKILNFKYRNKLIKKYDKEKIKNDYLDYKNGINNSRNYQIQAMAASIVNRAAIAINIRFKREGVDAYCCAQIHDQLIIDVPKDKKDYCLKIIQDLMENTTKLSLKLKAPPELAKNWYEGH